MKLTSKEAREVVWGDSKDWKIIKGTRKNIDNSRWSVVKTAIFHHQPTDKFYRFVWSVGATEYQDEKPYEYANEVEVNEVVEKIITRKEWVEV